MAFTNTAWGLETERSEDWRDDAACRPGTNVDPELFFFDGKGTYAQTKFDIAKAICFGSCPVREECLQYALESREAHGIYGGLTPDERRLPEEWRPLSRRYPRCKRGHPLEGTNVGTAPNGRYCRRCHLDRSREYQRLRRAKAAS